MPKGPNGEKRPADAVGLSVMIGKIATGEVDDQNGGKCRDKNGVTGLELQQPPRRKSKKSA